MDPVEAARRMIALLRSGAFAALWDLPPEDPLQPVREPKPVIPGGLRSSIAVDEPEPERRRRRQPPLAQIRNAHRLSTNRNQIASVQVVTPP